MLFDALLGVFMYTPGPFSNVAPVNQLGALFGLRLRRKNLVSVGDFRERWEPFMITL